MLHLGKHHPHLHYLKLFPVTFQWGKLPLCTAIILAGSFTILLDISDSIEYFWELSVQGNENVNLSIFASLYAFLNWGGWPQNSRILFVLLRTQSGIIWHLLYHHFSLKGWLSREQGRMSSAPVWGTPRGPWALVSNLRLEGWVRCGQVWGNLRSVFRPRGGSNTGKTQEESCFQSIVASFHRCPWPCCDSKEELNQVTHFKCEQWKNLATRRNLFIPHGELMLDQVYKESSPEQESCEGAGDTRGSWVPARQCQSHPRFWTSVKSDIQSVEPGRTLSWSRRFDGVITFIATYFQPKTLEMCQVYC